MISLRTAHLSGIGLLVLLAGIVYVAAIGSNAERDRNNPRIPVLVELFTSEGCSSCPPADRVLARLLEEQPVPGVEIVALGFHVDYWDRLGWRDPFSSSLYTDRQNAYARQWNASSIYTPQAVVDGIREFIGSDWNAARRHIEQAKSASKIPVHLTVEPSPANDRFVLRVDVNRIERPGATGDVLLAVVEGGLMTNVRRGENANRVLSHAAVVRSLERVATANLNTSFSTTRTASLNPAWNRAALRVVVFVQDPESLRVLGVAVHRL
jgi:hypothetical protein